MDKIYFYFILFLIYSFIGWIMEIGITYYYNKKIIDRGFLLGPYCPIYGYASIIMLFYLTYYKDNPLTVFLLAVIVCTFTEYLISYIMEKLFKARWWDYSNRKGNINGRVCLTNAFFFGVLGTLLVYYINPFFEKILSNIKPNTLNIISLILMILFTIDFIISIYATFKLKDNINKITKDNTEEFKNKIKEKIENTLLNKRIFKAYPKYKANILKKIEEYKEKIEDH